MPVEKPFFGAYGWVMDAILMGGKWPEANETSVFHLADTLARTARNLDEAVGVLDDARLILRPRLETRGGAAFDHSMRSTLGELTQQTADMRILASELETRGSSLEYTKLSMVVTGYVTIMHVFLSLLFAFLSGGVSGGLVLRAIALGRGSVANLSARLLTAMGRALPGFRVAGTARPAGIAGGATLAPTRAAPLSMRQAAVDATRQLPARVVATGRSLRTSFPKIARSITAEVLEGVVLVNGISTAIQLSRGHTVSAQATAMELVSSVVGGALGVPVGAFTHGLTRPLWAPMEAGLSRLLPTARTSFNGWMPPGVGGTAKWLSDAAVYVPGAMAANAIVSPFAGWVADGTVNGQWSLSTLASMYADSAGVSALSAVGRSSSPGMIELSRGARATVDYAIHGPSDAELARVERLNAALGTHTVEPYSLRLIDVYHDIPDAIDRHYAEAYFADRFPTTMSIDETSERTPSFSPPAARDGGVERPPAAGHQDGHLAVAGNDLLTVATDSEHRAQRLIVELRQAADDSALGHRTASRDRVETAVATYTERHEAVHAHLRTDDPDLAQTIQDQLTAEEGLADSLSERVRHTTGTHRAQVTAAAEMAHADLLAAQHEAGWHTHRYETFRADAAMDRIPVTGVHHATTTNPEHRHQAWYASERDRLPAPNGHTGNGTVRRTELLAAAAHIAAGQTVARVLDHQLGLVSNEFHSDAPTAPTTDRPSLPRLGMWPAVMESGRHGPAVRLDRLALIQHEQRIIERARRAFLDFARTDESTGHDS